MSDDGSGHRTDQTVWLAELQARPFGEGAGGQDLTDEERDAAGLLAQLGGDALDVLPGKLDTEVADQRGQVCFQQPADFKGGGSLVAEHLQEGTADGRRAVARSGSHRQDDHHRPGPTAIEERAEERGGSVPELVRIIDEEHEWLGVPCSGE